MWNKNTVKKCIFWEKKVYDNNSETQINIIYSSEKKIQISLICSYNNSRSWVEIVNLQSDYSQHRDKLF